MMSKDILYRTSDSVSRMVSISFAVFYSVLFCIWTTFIIILSLLHSYAGRQHWSNYAMPALLFACAAASAYKAGLAVGSDAHVHQRLRPSVLLGSSLLVSSSVAIALLLILLAGFLSSPLPWGLVLVAPLVVFVLLFVSNFFFHWGIAALCLWRCRRHA